MRGGEVMRGTALLLSVLLVSMAGGACAKKPKPTEQSAGVERPPEGEARPEGRAAPQPEVREETPPAPLREEPAPSPPEPTPAQPEKRKEVPPKAEEAEKEEPEAGMRLKAGPEEPALQEVFFDFDKATIRDDAKPVLEKNARWLAENPDVKIRIEGHCDERGTNEYNLVLGDRRAQAVKDFLVNLGIAPQRIGTISFGEENPICRDSTEECFQKNRRAHFTRAFERGAREIP